MRHLLVTSLLLSIFAATLSAQEADSTKPAPIKVVSSTPPSAHEEVDLIQQSLLTKQASIHFRDRPLKEVVAVLSDQWDVPMRIRERPLEEVALSPDIPVTLQLQGVSRDTILRWMLKEFDLYYDIDATGVVITSEDDLLTRGRVTRAYPIADLVDSVFTSEKGLPELFTTTIEPDSWSELGGPGEIAVSNGCLVVEHTLEMQAKVRLLLEAFRRAKNLSGDQYDVRPLAAVSMPQRSQELRQRMQSIHVTVDFVELPLEQAIAFLADAGEIPIHMDNRALEDIGLSSDIPVSARLSNVSLETVLDTVLDNGELCWLIDNDLLVVTTHSERETIHTVRVYPVRDLVWQGLNVTEPEKRLLLRKQAGVGWIQQPSSFGIGTSQGSGGFGGASAARNDFGFGGRGFHPTQSRQGFGEFYLVLGAGLPVLPQFEPLVTAIQTTIDVESWEDLGGPGFIEVFGDGDCLVVSQSEPVHERIETLLAQLRSQQSPDSGAKLLKQFEAAQAEEVVLSYTVSRPEWLKQKIESNFAADGWDSDKHYIDILQKTLVIRHRRDVQREIYRFLAEQAEAPPLTKYFPTWKTSPSALRGDNMPGGNF